MTTGNLPRFISWWGYGSTDTHYGTVSSYMVASELGWLVGMGTGLIGLVLLLLLARAVPLLRVRLAVADRGRHGERDRPQVRAHSSSSLSGTCHTSTVYGDHAQLVLRSCGATYVVNRTVARSGSGTTLPCSMHLW